MIRKAPAEYPAGAFLGTLGMGDDLVMKFIPVVQLE
jgi:hypothetical protein